MTKICPVCQKEFSKPAHRPLSRWGVRVHCSYKCVHRSSAVRAKIGAGNRGKVINLETRKKMSIASSKKTHTQETLTKMSASQKKRLLNPEVKAVYSRLMLKRWSDPNDRARMTEWARRGAMASRLANPSSIELSVRALLDKLEIPYVAEHRIGRYVIDIFIPDRRLVIECDGRYWHSMLGAKERDEKRDAYMVSLGYMVLRLPENEIKERRVEPMLLRAVGQNFSTREAAFE